MKKHIQSTKLLFSLLISLFLLASCTQNEPLKIALSKGYPYEPYQNYYTWIKSADSTIQVQEMYNYQLEEALKMMDDCDALLLSGGADIYPGRYGKEADTARCGGFDLKRDTLEFALIKKAMEMEIPIFGICRGQQMLNVAMGGTLYIDIPTDYDTTVVHRMKTTYECIHDMYVEPNTKLSWTTAIIKGETNSNHHQAVEKIADVFKVAARSSDGLIESIEWKNPEEKAFLMAVQWHPERMDLSNPLSGNLLEAFIDAVKESVIAKKEDAE
ncbi:MAG: gamma-glutamyl-gamma-aminobutyrate hydrolase [Bacteroidetes bacterium]|nr:gamma-glutamyl-gamma-aminobutyrate hydrolase [Bacteroidota bacterium]|tara:strand:- start:71 stop:883 length:813 start_codon:yes stop_codon:yes gene_type:complete